MGDLEISVLEREEEAIYSRGTFKFYLLFNYINGGKEMKKNLIALGAIAVILLMVSTVTAVPQVHSTPLMKTVSEIEQKRVFLEGEFGVCTEKLEDISFNVQLEGIIDTIIAIILFLINLLNSIIQFILDIMQIGNLILALIDAIMTLIDLITQFIEWVLGLFNPEDFTIIQ